ncbi:hypothetical protein GCK72_021839 [Caenorhabditis remanei]|uniref:Uncharacterized protein n=1 Tax=Caenorhabditis remanei TaxID=31234 RepID=A0A6A5GJ59_CAERE|nr:hypothetical protein GCK72_021839 [Caenorhabditis remanei]KAF1755270.1 hypothetical protein GCK72_021839 [Caenorhabditis remanei]
MIQEWSLDVGEFNLVLIVFSSVVVTLALIAIVILYCWMSCGCCKRKSVRRHSNIPHVMITQHRDKTPLSIDCPDLDFIDARNTNLVSSTVQVDSVHQTPTLS